MKTTFLFLGIIISTSVFAQTSDNPYDRQYEERDGLRRVEYRGKFGYIDAKGNEVIALRYAEAADFRSGLAKVSLDKKKYGYINTRGTVVVPLEYDDLFYGFSRGYTPAKKNGKWGLIDERGRLVVPHEYDYMYYPFEDLAIAGKRDGGNMRYGFVDTQGKLVIPIRYEYAYPFTEELARVKSGTKYGFINTKGETAISFKYEDARQFSDGMAAVKLNGKWGYINKTGEFVIRPEYKNARDFANGEAEVLKDDEGFYIDRQGNRLKNGKWLLLFTKGLNRGEQFWYRGEKWADELKKKYDQGYRYTDVEWNRYSPELFVTMSKTYAYWQSNFFHKFDFKKMWDKILEHYKQQRSIDQLSYNEGKWTFMFTVRSADKREVALHHENFPWTSVEKNWKEGKYITKMAYGDRFVIVMRNEKFADQVVKLYSNNRWDQEDMEAKYKRGYFITDLVKVEGTYFVVYTKGSSIKDQLLVWDEELPLRDIKGYWNKGWQSYRAIFIPREVSIDEDIW